VDTISLAAPLKRRFGNQAPIFGAKNAAKIPIMTITTINSMSVTPLLFMVSPSIRWITITTRNESLRGYSYFIKLKNFVNIKKSRTATFYRSPQKKICEWEEWFTQ
jgi:hypothetical protein